MILIKGGRMIDPKTGTDGQRDIVLADGRIRHIGKFHANSGYEQVIDARGLVIAPGLIDIHVHFRDPGLTHKEDILTGSAAAARGGFTTVVCMANTKPVTDSAETLRTVLDRAAQSPIRVRTVAAVSKGMAGKERTDFASLLALGAVGLSDDGIPLTDTAFLREAMRAAGELGVPLSLHEEDPALIGTAGVNAGDAAALLGLTGAPNVSESVMVARDCMLALDTGAQVHIQHLSCAESVAAVRLAKELGARVTAEATPAHFSLTDKAVRELGTLAKVNPPLRAAADRDAVITGLKDGSIDIIATDHAPHTAEEKSRPFAEAPSGLTGLETALSLGITHLVRKGHMDLIALIGKMTAAPARLYGWDSGCLREGGDADLVIFDENEQWTVGDFASRSANSPFVGQTLYGKVKYTVCGGKIVYRDGQKIAKGGEEWQRF